VCRFLLLLLFTSCWCTCFAGFCSLVFLFLGCCMLLACPLFAVVLLLFCYCFLLVLGRMCPLLVFT
jgi:hypothetical protein